MLPKVRSRSGTPVASDFSSADGSPLVQNNATGEWWGYSNGTVYPVGSTTLRGSGAKGDGSTDDTAAIATALATGKNVVGTPGDTYLIDGGLTAAAAGQRVDMTGCTVKLKNSATTKTMLSLTGERASVSGGIWDLNKANNASGDQYGHCAVLLRDEGQAATGMHVKDSHGLGIKGITGADNCLIGWNTFEGVKLHSVYVETTSGHMAGARILGNFVDGASMEAGAVGIYLIGDESSNKQLRWDVSHNRVVGPNSASETLGLTVRGYDGVYIGNQATFCTLAHSLDVAERCTVSGNRATDPASGTSYGIEINGGLNAITGNFVKGYTYGIATTGKNADYNNYSDNAIEDFVEKGVYINPGSGKTARSATLSGNTIKVSTGTNRSGIYFAGDCQYAHVSGNRFIGAGSGQTGCRAVYLDAVNGDVSIVANRFSGWERPVALYNPGAVAQNRVSFLANDCTQDMSAEATWLSLEGSATAGTGLEIVGNAPV
jgi:hypothetical protein